MALALDSSCAAWPALRRGTLLIAYRAYAGIAIAWYFVGLFHSLPGLIGRDGLVSVADAWPIAIDSVSLRVVTALGALLGMTAACGLAPQACALGIVVSALLIRTAAFATTTLDDRVVAIVAFWLCLMPAERGARAGHSIEARTASLFALHMLLLQLDAELWRAFSPHWLEMPRLAALSFSPLALAALLPSAPIRALASVGSAALHVFLAVGQHSGLGVAHALFAGLPLVLFSAHDRESARYSVAPWTVASVLGATVVALTIVWRLAFATSAGTLLASSQRVLLDLNLLPIAAEQSRGGALSLRIQADDGSSRVLGPGDIPTHARAEQLLFALLSAAPQAGELRQRLAAGVIRRGCRSLSRGASGTLIASQRGTETSIAWFECMPGSEEPRVVMLGDNSQANDRDESLEKDR